MKFITFSGVDGSGKSTQASLLRNKLEQDGKKVAYFHAVEFSLANRLMNQESRIRNQEKQDTGKSVTTASWFTIFLRKVFLIIDLVRFRLFYARLKREHYDCLISDRYFYDSLINIEYLRSVSTPSTAEETGSASLFSLLYSLFLVRPDTTFYFDLAPETIMARERAPEQGLDYLRTKMDLFKKKIPKWSMIVIDAEKDQDHISRNIQDRIEEIYSKNLPK